MEKNNNIEPEAIISRTAFCNNCFYNKSPNIGDRYLIYKGTHEEFYINSINSKNQGKRGFVPHLFILIDITEKGEIIYNKICGICGIEIAEKKNGDEKYVFRIKKNVSCKTSIENWNALVEYTRDKLFYL